MIKEAGVEGASALMLWSDKTSFIRFWRWPPTAHPLDEVADLLKGLIACPHAWYSAPDWMKTPRLLNIIQPPSTKMNGSLEEDGLSPQLVFSNLLSTALT